MKKLVIFGVGDNAQVAHYLFSEESSFEVCAFVVDKEYKTNSSLFGLPIVESELLRTTFPPDEYFLFIAIGYRGMNNVRKDKYNYYKSIGYGFANYISSKCCNKGLKIGENNLILEFNNIQPFVTIGNNNVLWSGNHIGHHSTIGDHNYFTSHVVISGNCNIGSNCFFGVNSTIRDAIKIADYTLVAAGALVIKDTLPKSVMIGTPAKCKDSQSSLDVKF